MLVSDEGNWVKMSVVLAIVTSVIDYCPHDKSFHSPLYIDVWVRPVGKLYVDMIVPCNGMS